MYLCLIIFVAFPICTWGFDYSAGEEEVVRNGNSEVQPKGGMARLKREGRLG